MAEGAFQDDAFYAGGFQISYSAAFAILEAKDQAAFSGTVTTKVTYTITENKDLAAFAAAASTIAGFDILEANDTATFDVHALDKRYVEFELLEAIDTATFETHVRHVVEFDLAEAPDVLVVEMTSTTYAGFDIAEIPDGAYFRSFAAFFAIGDADFIYVPHELNVVSVSPNDSAGEDAPMYVTPETNEVLLPPIPDVTLADEKQETSVPDEWQRMDVDETRTTRKG